MGIFIALEGPDGSGKSTLAKGISSYLEERGIDHLMTREPGGSQIGEQIRDIILHLESKEMTAKTEALLYAASRAQHIEEIINPALEKGQVVVSDRFVFSSLAYQGVGRGLGIDEVKAINDFAMGGRYPDLILFIHIDPLETLRRKTKGDMGDRLELEGDDFHKKVYQGYMEVIEKFKDKLVIIDGNQDKEGVFKDSIKEIEKVLGGKL